MNGTEHYPSNWKGIIIPEADGAPGEILEQVDQAHLRAHAGRGWVKPGDRVLDPFGGVALGALDAMRLGLNWTGIELEEKFHELGQQNIHAGLHGRDMEAIPGRPKMCSYGVVTGICARPVSVPERHRRPEDPAPRTAHLPGKYPAMDSQVPIHANFGTARLLHGDSRTCWNCWMSARKAWYPARRLCRRRRGRKTARGTCFWTQRSGYGRIGQEANCCGNFPDGGVDQDGYGSTPVSSAR